MVVFTVDVVCEMRGVLDDGGELGRKMRLMCSKKKKKFTLLCFFFLFLFFSVRASLFRRGKGPLFLFLSNFFLFIFFFWS